MKVGDYVRTLNGKIWIIKSQKAISGHKKDILKSSPNIIDLIEVGDYVNGKLVEDIFNRTNYADKSIKLKGSGDYWYNEHIKSIVTKEQFKNIEYEVE